MREAFPDKESPRPTPLLWDSRRRYMDSNQFVPSSSEGLVDADQAADPLGLCVLQASNAEVEPMMFQIVAMICVAGMEPQDCAPEVGHSRDVAIVGEVTNEIMCDIQAQRTLDGIAVFRNLAPGEFIKTTSVRKG